MRGVIDGIRRRRLVVKSHRPVKNQSLLWIILPSVAIATIGSYFLFFNTAPNQPTENVSQSLTGTNVQLDGQPPIGQGSVLTDRSPSTIHLYDSGAGPEAVKTVTSTLEGAGFNVSYLGVSQLLYDNVYIWHVPEQAELATKVRAALGETDAIVRPSRVNGALGILIYLGKK